ncbi:MAG: S41 family peptidase [Pirellulales bacterium]|nr:S41 family peptidase [Pirellulales bacterium]
MTARLFRAFTLLSVLTIGGGALSAEPIKFARNPGIANDGRIAFSYHGDIWVANPDGSNPVRLTAHIARDESPRFSPDGQSIAFNSNRLGNGDVWVIPATGGEPQQITFSSGGDSLQYWMPEGDALLINSTSGANPWGSPLHVVPLDASMPQPLPMDRAGAGMVSQDGTQVAFNRSGFRYWRKGYRGNSNTDIWVQDLASKEIRQLTDLNLQNFRKHTQDAMPMWGADGMIYFMSERDSIFNIWKIDPAGGEPQQVTHHKSDGVQYPSISPDGSKIVYENEFEIWRLDVPSGNPQKISLELAFDPKDNYREVLTTEDSADGFTPSPKGDRVAVDYHGEIFVVPVDADLGEKVQVTSSAWRERRQSWSPDGKYIAYISDKSLDEEIWLYNVEQQSHRQLTKQASLKSNYFWSPDSKSILLDADNKLFLVDVESGETDELAANEEGGFNPGSFSQDGKWIVYSRSDENLNSDVYLFNIEEKKEYNVTNHRFREFGGYLSGDGKHVIFVSNRSGSNQLYAVSLAKLTEDPDDPLVRANKGKKSTSDESDRRSRRERASASQDDTGQDDEKHDADKDEDERDDKALEVNIDLEGIKDRARRLTSGGSVGSFELAKNGKTIFFTRGGALRSIGVDGRGEKKIADGSFSGMEFSANGKYIFYRSDGGIARMSSSGGGTKDISFRFNVIVDHKAEWEQVFEESWRVMKYRFYDKDMHGVDWDATKERYKPLLPYVGENQDLYDLCNEMIGELNASHTGVSGPATVRMPSLYSTRHLGFEVEGKGDHYRVSHVYRHGPADKEWLNIQPGDFLLAIEGTEVHNGDNLYKLLNETINDYVDVTIAAASSRCDTPVDERDVRINAVGSVRNLQYQEWVEENREFVDKESGGKVGYVHIRSMNQASLAQFEQEINQFWNKNGMIIDIRYNGGGNIDQQLIDILERRPYEYWNSRLGGRAAGRRPRQAIAGPKVMLINWRSASDSEVTPQGFRDLKLGRIVGNPTYGAVIATGSYRLLNGGSIRTPGSLVVTYDPSQPNNYGINLENFGVAPDVWVENSPKDELQGFDRELKTAVDEALKMLAEGDWQYGEDK